jgi:hypothetical protein
MLSNLGLPVMFAKREGKAKESRRAVSFAAGRWRGKAMVERVERVSRRAVRRRMVRKVEAETVGRGRKSEEEEDEGRDGDCLRWLGRLCGRTQQLFSASLLWPKVQVKREMPTFPLSPSPPFSPFHHRSISSDRLRSMSTGETEAQKVPLHLSLSSLFHPR